MKKNLLFTFLVFLSLAITAQEDSNDEDKSVRPSKRNFTVGLSMGSNPFLNTNSLNLNSAGSVSGDAVNQNNVLGNNSFVNMIGVDARYFLSNSWALTFSGAMSYDETPVGLAIPAVVDGSGNTIVPGYNATVQESTMNFMYSVGANYFFDYKKNDRIMPYLGVSIPVSHGRRSSYDPTIVSGSPVQLGQSHVEVFGMGVQVVAGLDYYLSDGIFLGASIRPVSFMSFTTERTPGPGLLSNNANTYNLSSFVQPMLALGFKL